MTADKYLTWDTTTQSYKEVIATDSSAGAGDAGEIVALDATGKIAENMMPAGVAAETVVCKAGSGGVAENDVVYIHLVTVTLTATKADATDHTKPAMGYVKAAGSEGDDVTVYLDGELPGAGFAPKTKYYLTTTPGTVSATAPSANGNVAQCVGIAVSATAIKFEPALTPIVIAA